MPVMRLSAFKSPANVLSTISLKQLKKQSPGDLHVLDKPQKFIVLFASDKFKVEADGEGGEGVDVFQSHCSSHLLL